jgi:hypothetical protein
MGVLVGAVVAVDVGVLANRGVRAGFKDLVRRTVGEDLAVDHDQAVEPLARAVEVVRRHQNREPVRDEPAHEPQQRIFGRRVDAGRRLVEQQQQRLLRDRARDECALLLPAGERADVAVGETAPLDRFDRARAGTPDERGERAERRL